MILQKKHQQFALSCALRPSTTQFLWWLMRRSKKHEISEIEIDLRVFNQWVAKHRGRPYDRKTLKEALAQLDEKTNGLVLITKSYTWAIKKVIVRPLEMVLQKNSPKLGLHPKPDRANPMFSDAQKKAAIEQQQLDISKICHLFDRLKLPYTIDSVKRFWRLSGKNVAEVKNAVKLLLFQHSTQKEKKIESPMGWLHHCLLYGWQKGLNLYYQTELPYFESVRELEGFVDKPLGGQPLSTPPPCPT